MKKIFYLICSLMIVLSSCDPMEEVYEELDALPEGSRAYAITLIKTNYESLRNKPNVPSYVNTGLYFASEEQASNLIPLYLNTAYAHFNNGDAIDVTYNLLTFDLNNTVRERITYALTAQSDYTLGGASFANFDKWSQIETFLKAKYPTPQEGTLVTLTFTWFNSNAAYPHPTDPNRTVQTKTVTDSYYFANGRWYDTYMVTNEDYLSVDRNRNNAFASADEAELIPGFLNKFLKNSIVGAQPGDIQYASYLVRYSSTSTLRQVKAMVFDGSNWNEIKSDIIRPATLTFVKKDGMWYPDLTVRYSLIQSDYETIAGIATVGTQSNRDNLKQFRNFYQAGSTTDARYWTDAQIQAGLAALLKVKFPNAEVGQKYQLTYIVYKGSNTTVQTTFIKTASGDYEVFKG